jgi:hypothetical protein
VLVNLGTPDAPTRGAVKRYLKQFLSDPRVVEIPRAVWWFILNLIILPFRSGQSAKKYATIWKRKARRCASHQRQAMLPRAKHLGDRGHEDVQVLHGDALWHAGAAGGAGRAKAATAATASWCCRPTRSIPAPPPARSGMPFSPTTSMCATCPNCGW